MASSSRVRVFLGCSVDGFIAGPDNDLSFLHGPNPPNPPAPSDGYLTYQAFMSQVGVLLMGRQTFDVVSAMDIDWPYGDTPVLVATHRPLEGAPSTVRAVAGDIRGLIAEAKATAGDRDVYLDGGNLARQGLDAGLVDELCLTLLPVLLGGTGTRLFDGLVQTHLMEFVGHHTGENGMVQLTLRPRPSSSRAAT